MGELKRNLIKRILREQLNDDSSNEIVIDDVIKKISPSDKVHMSQDPNLQFKNVDPQNQPDSFKPKGLWYSMGTEWIEFIETAAGMGDRKKDYIYNIDTNDSTILTLGKENEKMFLKKYGVKEPTMGKHYYSIDWSSVATKWDGVEILINPRELDNFWIWSTWDIASGCIWNINGIKSVRKL